MFGNAIHRTLDTFFRRYAKGEDMIKSELLATMDRELEKEYLTDKELKDMKKEGEKALSGYFDEHKDSWSREIKCEMSVDTVIAVLDLNVRLTGKLDKVEIHGGSVSVVDYKTGSIKSRNELEGKTNGADGNYKRQLVFYKLLLDRFEDGKYDMKTGTIDFIIPDKKGEYHREVFDITEDEVMALEEALKKAIIEITDLSFWDKRCDDENCEYCSLRRSSKNTE
jgi:hypothetical protein